MELNLLEPIEPERLQSVKLVMMCLDQTDTRFVESCIQAGADYIDITANFEFLSRLESLGGLMEGHRTAAVISVGLAPGLTNLMAMAAKKHFTDYRSAEITIMLGLGEAHGRAAMEWTLDQLNTRYAVMQEGSMLEVVGFTGGQKTDFGPHLGKRTGYLFNFSDQHVLPRTVGVRTATTRLCFDSRIVTKLVAGAKSTGILRLLRYRFIREAALKLFGLLRAGQELFAVKVDAKGVWGDEERVVELTLTGKREAEVTGIVAAAAAARLYRSDSARGLYHLEQFLALDDLVSGELSGCIEVKTEMTVVKRVELS